jgi:hypothetical protein
VSFAAITICIASQRVFIVVSVYFVNRINPETFGNTLLHDALNIFVGTPSRNRASQITRIMGR